MLYLVATPIGNLGDFSPRAVEVLKECDYILCEDTRRSITLLNQYGIVKPLKSYHKFNEASRLQAILYDLKRGLKIALISDSGMPSLSDPGERLVNMCHNAKVPLTVVPGPTAIATALVLSGFCAIPFQFLGFMPKKPGERRKLFTQMLSFPGTSIVFERPSRLPSSLGILVELESSAKVAIVREMTKKFEEVIHGRASELLALTEKRPLRGEAVLLIDCSSKE